MQAPHPLTRLATRGRLAAVALVASVTLAASGCGSSSPPPATPQPTPGGSSFSAVAFATPVIQPTAPRLPTSKPEPTATLPTTAEPRKGFIAPDFELEALDGGTVKLSDLRGRPVFINFWATWCQPCKIEMPDIQEVHHAYKDQGLVVLGVDVQEPHDKVKTFLDERPFTWKMILDAKGDTMRTYRVTGIPSSFFIDRDGVIRDIVIGFTSKEVMEAKVRPLLQ